MEYNMSLYLTSTRQGAMEYLNSKLSTRTTAMAMAVTCLALLVTTTVSAATVNPADKGYDNLGMLTFFLFIGGAIVVLDRFINFASVFLYIAYFVAILLAVLGMFMLMGGTAKLMGFVQNLVDRWSTSESDETFTPRRNMYLKQL